MKKIIILVLSLMFFIPSSVYASVSVYERDEITLDVREDVINNNNREDILSTPKVNEKEKVYDFANLFSSEEEDTLYEHISSYIDEYNYDMVIVTISSNNKGSASSYADDFYDYNYFGFDESYSGILYLIDMDTREIWITTIGEAIDRYSDEFIDSILDEVFVYVSSGDYYGSALSFIEESNYFAENYELDDSGNLMEVKKVNWTLSLVLSFVIATVVVVIQICSHKKVRLATAADDYIDRSATKIFPSQDRFVTSNTSRVCIRSDSGSSGGGRSGGGSSTRIGSSGRSHGGGGRRF